MRGLAPAEAPWVVAADGLGPRLRLRTMPISTLRASEEVTSKRRGFIKSDWSRFRRSGEGNLSGCEKAGGRVWRAGLSSVAMWWMLVTMMGDGCDSFFYHHG